MGLQGKATLHLTDVETGPRGIPLQIYCIGGWGKGERGRQRECVWERKGEGGRLNVISLVLLFQVYVTGLFYIMSGAFSKDQFYLTLKEIGQGPSTYGELLISSSLWICTHADPGLGVSQKTKNHVLKVSTSSPSLLLWRCFFCSFIGSSWFQRETLLRANGEPWRARL